MNKTLKTVLITLGAVFVFLVIIVWLFGEDSSTPANTSSNGSQNVIEDSEAQNSSTKGAKISAEVYKATLAYDIFDWNSADEQGKIEIANKIIKIWNEAGTSCEMTVEELASYISQNLSDQANIFEVACIAAQIDPLPYQNRAE